MLAYTHTHTEHLRASYWFSELKNVCKQSTLNHFFRYICFTLFSVYFFLTVSSFLLSESITVDCWRTFSFNGLCEYSGKKHIRRHIYMYCQALNSICPYWECRMRQNVAAFSSVRKFIFSPHLTSCEWLRFYSDYLFISTANWHIKEKCEQTGDEKKRNIHPRNQIARSCTSVDSSVSFFFPVMRYIVWFLMLEWVSKWN